MRAVRAAVLQVLEALIITAVAVWMVVGLIQHARDTGWKLNGLLTMLHEQWRGAIILGILLFYQTVREGLDQAADRVKLKGIKVSGVDLGFEPTETLKPGGEKQK